MFTGGTIAEKTDLTAGRIGAMTAAIGGRIVVMIDGIAGRQLGDRMKRRFIAACSTLAALLWWPVHP
jgi:hypothetical protein